MVRIFNRFENNRVHRFLMLLVLFIFFCTNCANEPESQRDQTDPLIPQKSPLNKCSNITSTCSSSKDVANNEENVEKTNVRIANFSTTGVRVSDLYTPGHSDPNSDRCGPGAGKNINLLILVESDPKRPDARTALRQTWGQFSRRRDVVMAFILGETHNHSIEESDMYGDIIRAHFVDSYYNLTLKTISLLEWTDRYCSRAKFILKADDDVFINVPKLLSFIEEHRGEEDQKYIYGMITITKFDRYKTSKYYISPQDYFPTKYPYFAFGPSYLMTRSVVHDSLTTNVLST